VQYYPDPQKAMSEEYTRKDINDKDAKIAAKQQEIAKLKQGLADLEDDLRKSGGDQGWSRE
jgi:septal ring factor EnvC (AmiA/AmiB activator)